MDISLFDYDLPPELVAQFPARRRDESRLMVLDRATGGREFHPFKRVIDYLNPGDALVVNNTKVFKARLFGARKTGAKVEIFLIRPVDRDSDQLDWYALVNPSRRVKVGEKILFDDYRVTLSEDVGGGRWIVTFGSRSQRQRVIGHSGHVPLPHYIRREDKPEDIRRYQTVFADPDKVGAVAAPTAGFHFTKPLLGELERKGIRLIEVTLHVGPGTFKPVSVDNIYDHTVDPEFAELTVEAAEAVNDVRNRGGKIFAVGTTSVRTLESAQIVNGRVEPLAKMVDLYVKPGHTFQLVDHMITNFHLPKSSLLILVSAFTGRERILDAYRAAIESGMRFYSYGDAMLIR